MATIRKELFGTLGDGRPVEAYILRNTKGSEARILPYGARLVAWRFMARDFKFIDVLPGYGELAAYERDRIGLGAVVDAAGGSPDRQLWEAEEAYEGLRLVCELATGKGSTARLSVLYGLSNDNELSIRYEAVSDDGAELGLSGRTYFNLDGYAAGSIAGHRLRIFASRFAALQEGAFCAVDGTAMDFRQPARIGGRTDGLGMGCRWLLQGDPAEAEMEPGMFGYDPACPIDYLGGGLKNAAEAMSGRSGILLRACTTEPWLAFRPGIGLAGGLPGKPDAPLSPGSGFCLEPCGAARRLEPGVPWRAQTVYALKALD